MQAHVDDRIEFVNDSLRHWKPVKVISDCRCNAVKLSFPHNQSYNSRHSNRNHCKSERTKKTSENKRTFTDVIWAYRE